MAELADLLRAATALSAEEGPDDGWLVVKRNGGDWKIVHPETGE